jgi:hypothetical protein
LSALQPMPVQSKKPWINPAPRWWMTQRPRPCVGAQASYRGCRPQKGDKVRETWRAQ